MSFHWVQPFCTLLILIVRIQAISLVQLTFENTPVTLFADGQYSGSFLSTHKQLSCSFNSLYTYKQSPQNLQNNTAYQLQITGLTNLTAISISTQYNIITPTLSQPSCTTDCSIQISNNCPNPVNMFHYFDTIILNIEGLQTFSYNVLCNRDYGISTFQAGIFIIMVGCLIVIILSVVYSRAWAFQIVGVQVTYLYIGFYWCAQVIGDVLIIVDVKVAQIVGDVVIWVLGSFGIIVCLNEILFKFRVHFLNKTLLNIKNFRIRVTDAISFLISLAILLIWILNDKNWIVSDIISVTIIIASIKIFKITSFKKALVFYFGDLTIEVIFVILIKVLQKSSYDDFLLDNFNNPLLLQIPTINPVYGLKCSWIPIYVIIFPGILISYLRRFDKSRNTNIYLVTSFVSLCIGSILWIIANSISVQSLPSLPFEVIAEPVMLFLVFLFSYNRKELKVLWNGKFYDPEFKNQEQHEEQTYNYEMETKKGELNQNFFNELKIKSNQQDQQSQPSENQRKQYKGEEDSKSNSNQGKEQQLNQNG